MTHASMIFKRILHIIILTLTLQLFSDVAELRKKIQLAISNNLKGITEGPLVSIVVPTWNDAQTLASLLLSIKIQSYKNIEVIVADYRSTDGTLKLAKGFGAKVLKINMKGIGYASAQAVLSSKGQIILRTDADSFFPKWLVSRVVTCFSDCPSVMMVHGGHLYYDAGFFTNILAHLYDKNWRLRENPSGFFIAFRRSGYFQVGGFENVKYGEDWRFGQKVRREFGEGSIRYDHSKLLVFTSARNLKTKGFMRNLFSETTYHETRNFK